MIENTTNQRSNIENDTIKNKGGIKNRIDNVAEKVESVFCDVSTKTSIILLVISLIALIMSLFFGNYFPIDPAWIAIICCGIPIVIGAITALITKFDIKADVLVSIALTASIVIGQYFAAGEVAFIMQIGALLETLTVKKSQSNILKLIELTPRTAHKIQGKTETIIEAKEVKIGDLLRVLPGESIPVDGKIISGQTTIDESIMTGEPMPVDKNIGDRCLSGTINQFGSIVVKAEKVGADSSIQQMIELVESADANKAHIVRLADRWATWFVVIALCCALATGIVTQEIIRAVTVLVVFCPCALVLATPAAIMAAIGNATKRGFLTRTGDSLERMSHVKCVAFDKTGTLTFGKPYVKDIYTTCDTYSKNEIFKLAYLAETQSEHPLGKAIVSSFLETVHQKNLDLTKNQSHITSKNNETKTDTLVRNFKLLIGKGLTAQVENKSIGLLNRKGLKEQKIYLDQELDKKIQCEETQGHTVVFVVTNKKLIGYIVLADQIRTEAKNTVAKLKSCGLIPILISGDNAKAVQNIAQKIGIEKVYANCLPADKVKIIENYEKNKMPVCMIGDGINDAPALKRAFVSIAMGKIGSDIAANAADVVLVKNDISEIPYFYLLAKHTLNTIKINLSAAMAINLAATILAVLGILDPVIGALVHNAGSVAVIGNSALLLGWKGKNKLK